MYAVYQRQLDPEPINQDSITQLLADASHNALIALKKKKGLPVQLDRRVGIIYLSMIIKQPILENFLRSAGRI